MGRPTKCDDLTTKRIADSIAAGNTRAAAAKASGLHPETVRDWERKGELGDERYSAFSVAIKKAEGQAEAEAVRVVREAALSGTWQAAAWWLERRRHEDWARRDPPEEKPEESSPWGQLTVEQRAELVSRIEETDPEVWERATALVANRKEQT